MLVYRRSCSKGIFSRWKENAQRAARDEQPDFRKKLAAELGRPVSTLIALAAAKDLFAIAQGNPPQGDDII